MPEARVNQLGYVGFGVKDMNAWEQFAVNTLGLQDNGRGQDGSLFLKMDDYHHRIVLHPNGSDDIVYAGWQVRNEEELEAIAKQLKNGGVEIIYGSDGEAKERRVTGLIRFDDPIGLRTEVFYGPEVNYVNNFKSTRNITGFETGMMGIGHIVFVVPDFEKHMHFYRDLMGFRVSDIMERPGSKMGFMHCNPRHHSFAFLQGMPGGIPESVMPAAKKLNHLMIQLKTLDDVGSTYYMCQEKGYNFRLNLGRHGNDHMVSFYVTTPSGFAIEYGWGGRTIDDNTWQVTRTPGDPWGHLVNMPPVAQKAPTTGPRP